MNFYIKENYVIKLLGMKQIQRGFEIVAKIVVH